METPQCDIEIIYVAKRGLYRYNYVAIIPLPKMLD
jgi:hypothetical protein